MTRRPAALAAACALVAALPPAAPIRAQVPFPEASGFHNTTYVGDEPEAARLAFYRADEHRKSGRLKEAGAEILKLLRGDTAGRVRFDERLVVPVETAALFFLLDLPDEVRAELAREEAELEPAPPADPDPAALRAWAARHPLSPRSAAAWLRAGTLELLAGDAAGAAADLERLVHWPVASSAGDAERALAAARLVQAQARLHERPVEGPLARWPLDATVVERGDRRTPLSELLAAARTHAPAAPGDATSLFGDDAHAARPQFPAARPVARFVEPHAGGSRSELRGRSELAPHRLRFKLASEPGDPESELDRRDLPFRAPLLLGDRLITVERVTAPESFDPQGGGGPVAIHVRRLPDGSELFAPIRSDFDLHLDPDALTIPLDRVGLSARGERLYVTFELREAGRGFRDFLRANESARTALFVLDLAREGFVETAVTSDDLAADPALARHVFAGPAVEHGARSRRYSARTAGL